MGACSCLTNELHQILASSDYAFGSASLLLDESINLDPLLLSLGLEVEMAAPSVVPIDPAMGASTSFFDHFRLVLSPAFPVDIVLPASVVESSYNRVFVLILQLKFAQFRLSRWRRGQDPVGRTLARLRFEMLFFVNRLIDYVTTTVCLLVSRLRTPAVRLVSESS